MKKGLLITIEGVDGSGKTTQIELLECWLKGRAQRVLVSREPGGCEVSERIRDLLLDGKNAGMSPRCEALLFAASRAQHVDEVIRPELEKGGIVLCGRFVHSSLAYQGIARGLGIEPVNAINEFALGGISPDLVLMLSLSPEDALLRRAGRNKDRIESESGDFFARVERGFELLANSDKSIVKIDAGGTVEQVHERIKTVVKERLGI